MDVTDSSPLSLPPASQGGGGNQQQAESIQYRTARELPFELNQHVQVYFEESMFAQGFRLLLSIMSADASTAGQPITVPAPMYLAMTSTLSVHPALTTRTLVRDKWEQANAALRVLRFLLKTTGPVNSSFTRAFSFTKYERVKDQDRESDFNSYYADEGSLWSQAEDFWAVVGWALNCACLSGGGGGGGVYATRWQRWNLWLEFMLDVLETDWRIHYHSDTCEETLLWQYIELASGGGGGNTRARRMLRAIFANGSTPSLNEFRPVFRRELKEPRPVQSQQVKKRRVNVNVDAEIYGDYLTNERDDSDEDVSSENESGLRVGGVGPGRRRRSRTRTPSRRPTPRSSNQSLRSEFDHDLPQKDSTGGQSSLGSPESIGVRLRLMHLLSHVAGHPTLTSESPTTFPSQDELYTLYVEFIKPLPLGVFQQIISPSIQAPNITLSEDAHSTLCEFLLQRTIESAAPTVRSEAYLTQSKLVGEYLPFSASRDTIDANCRVSILLESLVRRLYQASCLSYTPELSQAVESGISRRLTRVETKRKKTAVEKDDEVAWYWLIESGERMRMVVHNLASVHH